MENKRVTHTARLILRIWNCGLFAVVWFLFYNAYMFDTYRVRGVIFSVVCFLAIYTILCDVYKAFRIASTSIGEIVLSHFISFATADLILYVECCLVYNKYVNILPGAWIVVLQLLGTMLVVTVAKRYFMHHVEPQNTLLVYGEITDEETAKAFAGRLLVKYSHLFRIDRKSVV